MLARPLLLLVSCTLTATLLPVLAPTRASAAGTPDAPVSIDEPAERRSGLVLGTTFGFNLAGSSGYPNNATQIGSHDYYSSSNLMTGGSGNFLLMGAFADYLNFGIWFGGGTFQSDTWKSTGGGGGFRVEVFPLYRVYPKLRDLGVAVSLGVGSARLETKLPGKYPSADGVQSFLGAGVFYEFTLAKLIGGHLAAGPNLEYDVVTSQSIERHSAMLGARIAFYGGM